MTISSQHFESAGRVVVGIDGSPDSLEALRWALTYARHTGSAIEVVASWDWPADPGGASPLPSDYQPQMSAEQVLDSVLEKSRTEFPNQLIEGKVVQGHAAPILVEASKGADLLVVGSRGHGELVGMLIGSVSQYCATHAHCPVLVHRTDS